MGSYQIGRRSFLLLSGAALARGFFLLEKSAAAQPVIFSKGKIGGISFYKTIVDLTDPNTFISIGLANNASKANTNQSSNGDEEFSKMVARHKASVVANGTFFAKSAQKTVMGNMVAGGKFVKYSQLGQDSRKGNVPLSKATMPRKRNIFKHLK
jgi:exopolysaccharide biosynthesis protein